MNTQDLFREAAQQLIAEKASKYKFLPGDPINGTIYKGFISKVEMVVVSKSESPNFGREMLVIRTQVKEGQFKGWEETFNRVLHPESLDEPTAAEWKIRTENYIAQLKGSKNPPSVISEKEIRQEIEAAWREKVLEHLKFTLVQFSNIGVDISSQDEATILALAANSAGNPAVWKVYDPDNVKYKYRRSYLENVANYFKSEKSLAPNLFEELPTGNDIPI